MWQVIMLCSALATSAVVLGDSGETKSKGKWKVLSVEKCADPDKKYCFGMEVAMNCTDDESRIWVDLSEEINDKCGMRVEMCNSDDDCEEVMKESCLCEKMKKHKSKTECPIPKGTYDMESIFNLPEETPQGIYMPRIYLMKDDVDVACFNLQIMIDCSDADDAE